MINCGYTYTLGQRNTAEPVVMLFCINSPLNCVCQRYGITEPWGGLVDQWGWGSDRKIRGNSTGSLLGGQMGWHNRKSVSLLNCPSVIGDQWLSHSDSCVGSQRTAAITDLKARGTNQYDCPLSQRNCDSIYWYNSRLCYESRLTKHFREFIITLI